jgi:hypothetical protein
VDDTKEQSPVPSVVPAVKGKHKGGPFQQGHRKFGGRQKGTRNKRTVFAHEVAEKMGVDPLRFLLEIIKADALQIVVTDPFSGKVLLNEDGTPKRIWVAVTTAERLDASKTLIGYMYPKLQALSLSSPDGGPVEVATFDLTNILTDPRLARAAQEMALMLAEQESGDNAPRAHRL